MQLPQEVIAKFAPQRQRSIEVGSCCHLKLVEQAAADRAVQRLAVGDDADVVDAWVEGDGAK